MESRLSMVREVEPRNRARYALYLCSCGKAKKIMVSNVESGKTKSCGCYWAEQVKKSNKKYTDEQRRAYQIWCGIKGRCFVKSNTAYKKYGGAGITCCEEWKDSFISFWNDMGAPPDGFTIDRIDNSKGYSKENCRWSSIFTQASNKSRLSGKGEIKFRGVHRVSGRKTYISIITVKGERIVVYRGKSCVNAIKARCKAEIKYFGFILGASGAAK